MSVRTRTWVSGAVAIFVLLLSLAPVGADDAEEIAEEIAEECGELAEEFAELAEAEDVAELLEEADEFYEEFEEFFDDIVDEADDDEAVAMPYTATETADFDSVAIEDLFVDELGVLHFRGFSIELVMTGDLVGLLTWSDGRLYLDLATENGLYFGLISYDISFNDLSGTFEGCNVVPQCPPDVPLCADPILQVGAGTGDFEGMILAAVVDSAIGELPEAGIIFAVEDD